MNNEEVGDLKAILEGDHRLNSAPSFECRFRGEVVGSSTLSGAGIFFPFPFSLIALPNDRVDETAALVILAMAPPLSVARLSNGEDGGRGKNMVLWGLDRRLCEADADGRGTPRRGL
jgi:hypothetical protein